MSQWCDTRDKSSASFSYPDEKTKVQHCQGMTENIRKCLTAELIHPSISERIYVKNYIN